MQGTFCFNRSAIEISSEHLILTGVTISFQNKEHHDFSREKIFRCPLLNATFHSFLIDKLDEHLKDVAVYQERCRQSLSLTENGTMRKGLAELII